MQLKTLVIKQGDGTIIREIIFGTGLNLIVDETLPNNQKATGNNVGKTTVLKLIDYCLGGKKQIIWQDGENKGHEIKEVKDFLVEKNVYDKGDEHTSSTFKWTADYCYELNELRFQSIPAEQHRKFLSDTVADRLANMLSVAMWSRRKEWIHSKYYEELLRDMQVVGRELNSKEKLFLSLPSLQLRRLYSTISRKIRK